MEEAAACPGARWPANAEEGNQDQEGIRRQVLGLGKAVLFWVMGIPAAVLPSRPPH